MAASGDPKASHGVKDQMQVRLIGPLIDAFELAPAGRSHVEAVAALVAGLSFLLDRIHARELEKLSPEELTDLLTPAVQARLDSAPKNTDRAI